jgi:hypothetical protein
MLVVKLTVDGGVSSIDRWGRASFFPTSTFLDVLRSLYMITHLHPPTSSSPLDLVRDGLSLFVLGSDYQF